jgi:bis(5'-nucleosidyl)-tetraphosphatase
MQEISYGIIPLTKRDNQWWVLLIQHRNGLHWAFPKGHSEPTESPQQTAERELFEETGLALKRFLFPETLSEAYTFSRHDQTIHKVVHYFLAEVEGMVTLQSSEILSSRWILLSEASQALTFSESRALCEQARRLLTS